MIRYLLFARILGIVVLSFTASFLMLKGFLFIPALFVFCILALSVFLYKDQQKTVKRMEYLIESIHYGDLSLFYPSDSMTEDEKALASSMNAALEALRSRLYSSVVAEAETEAWQKLIRVLPHEIMNSIAPVISLSETVAERATINGMNEKDYAIMVQAMQTIHRRSKGLLDFVENYRKLTRLPLPTLRNFSVSALFDDIRLLFPEKSDILFFHVKPEDLNLYADRIMVEQVLINLLKNAIEACEESLSPQIIVEAVQKNGMVIISVIDNGSGIVPEAIDKIFVPFFTTKSKGSGIGLSLCRQIMNRHRGSISLDSQVEKGSSFVLRFPIVTKRIL